MLPHRSLLTRLILKFIRHVRVESADDLIKNDHKLIEACLIDYLVFMNQKGYAYATKLLKQNKIINEIQDGNHGELHPKKRIILI